MSIGNGVTIPFSDTVKVEGLTEDSLLLSRGETVLHRYRRSVEECGFSANPGEIVRGTVTFAHEVRTFRPLNDTAVYWLVDRSGYLQQRYSFRPAGVAGGCGTGGAACRWCGVGICRTVRRRLPGTARRGCAGAIAGVAGTFSVLCESDAAAGIRCCGRSVYRMPRRSRAAA